MSCILLTEICKSYTYAKIFSNVALIKLFSKPFQKLKMEKNSSGFIYCENVRKAKNQLLCIHFCLKQ